MKSTIAKKKEERVSRRKMFIKPESIASLLKNQSKQGLQVKLSLRPQMLARKQALAPHSLRPTIK